MPLHAEPVDRSPIAHACHVVKRSSYGVVGRFGVNTGAMVDQLR